jgi:hypothetical protein
MSPISPRTLRPMASGFSPARISGLANWWDASASSTVTLNGTTVSSWANRASGPALAQGTAAAQPTYTLSGVSGKNVLTFDGGDVLSASATYGTQSNTIFFVAREDSPSAFAGFFCLTPPSGNDQSNSNALLVEQAGTDNIIVVQRGDTASASNNPRLTGSSLLPLSVISVRGSSSVLGLRNNGTLVEELPNTFSGTSSGILVGGRYQSGAISASFRSIMTMCEIIHYSRALTDSEMSRIQGYLGAKWGVTVA